MRAARSAGLLGRRQCLAVFGCLAAGRGWAGASPEPMFWRELLPPDWDLFVYRHRFRQAFPSTDDIDDRDPRMPEILARMRELGSSAPGRKELQGRHIRLPGFAAPVQAGSHAEMSVFLLTPHQTGCIHKPPPPANQAVLVESTQPLPVVQAGQVIWIQGVLEVVQSKTPLGTAAYRMLAATTSPFDWKLDGRYLLTHGQR